MRYSPEHKQESRNRVLAAAARAIREQGPDNVSVAAVMAEAGLTHGGFYAHFASKGALIVAAIDFMFDETAARLDKRMNGKSPREALLAYIDHYLSATHCAARNTGCPIAALGSDIPRLDDETRAAFARGMERQHERIAGQLQLLGYEDADSMARSMRSEMFGALLSARLVDGEEREEILETSRRVLLKRFHLETEAVE
ncbi:TetR/AcrR family transcriptional regulator [Burkholderia gladioli]|uniref:TetR/AcrR family transcriptional regulator n=1 Tax=Burkholderia gladioli TaxID=28095 RepID=UPI0016418943|nr:TetR/AcrR family transcriptional regulator [Burkholderia gladioli]